MSRVEMVSDSLERLVNELVNELAQVCGSPDEGYFEYVFQYEPDEEEEKL